MTNRNTRNLIATTLATTTLAATAAAQSYEHTYQYKNGRDATFLVEGPATGSSPDVQGDAMLTEVRMATGDSFHFFYKPEAVADVNYVGTPGYETHWLVRAGTNTSTPLSGNYPYSDYDHSQAATDAFAALTLNAFSNNNLNNYLDTHHNNALWEITVKFEMVVKDDDPDPDEFGEILYFERGSGNGNSWIKMQAVDEAGSPLGPWLVIGPGETVQTTPQTAVYRIDQKMGTTSIDVSRLGVEEFQYLRISNVMAGEPAYTGGGDINPDFKVMVVMTNEDQLKDMLGHYD